MTAEEHQVCLLLGSNIQPEKNIVEGVNLLRARATLVCSSSVWETPSEGAAGPNFLNLSLLITTPLPADELKETILRPIEAQLGRVRSADKNAPRPIDLDIVFFDGHLLDPTLWLYAHRAVPVAEIFPEVRSDQGLLLKNVAAQLAKTNPIRLRADVRIDHRLHAG